jgi:hypothetical protein
LLSFLLGGVHLLAVTAEAAVQNTTISTTSRSGQFIIISPLQPAEARLPRDNPKNNPALTDVIRVNAAEFTISCEQVKSALLLQLDTTDRWRSRVRVVINPEIPAAAGVYVYVHKVQVNDNLQSNWLYELQVPEYVERRKLLRGLVQVCLLEMGNRNNAGPTVDIPMWLREGLTELLLIRVGPTIIAEASIIRERVNPQFSLLDAGVRERVWKDPLSTVREKLKVTPPLSFSDLSVPVDDQLASVGLQHFQHCAHLFTSELMALPEGSERLRGFVQSLARFSHPQFAFLNAFQQNFSTPLDVEKWWSLAQVNFLSREDHARWPEKNALGKLNEILQPQVQIRLGADALPIKETYTIKRLIEEVDFEQQQPVLRQVVGQLQQLEGNLPPDLFRLVYDYHIALATYLYKREQLSSSNKSNRTASSNAKPVVKEALKQLELLEILREDFARIGFSETPANSVAKEPVKDFLKSTP